MKHMMISLHYVVGVVFCMSLVGGCSSSRYDLCVQERDELQQKVEAQQVQIDELQGKVEETNTVVQKMSTQLQQCTKQRIKLRQDRATKTASNVGNPNPNPNPRYVPKRKTKTSSKTTTKKAGCPCRRKPTK